jgi:DNA (cytosine-5)-methyltransferase 1
VDIATVRASDVSDHDLLVAGFPCQDYSVATTKAEGIHGRKGVLWWEINRILEAKRPPFVILENVDRLVKSPAKQLGRDFGVILWCLDHLGYSVEWRVINAADYGAPQRRRRTFILGASKLSELGREMLGLHDRGAWLERVGFFANCFPAQPRRPRGESPLQRSTLMPRSLQSVSDDFSFRFQNAGIVCDRDIWTLQVRPKGEREQSLATVLEKSVPDHYFVPESSLKTWMRLKGAKAEKRVAKNGYEYRYSEGAIPFPDPIDRPARTIMTTEGGISPSRFKHIIQDPGVGRYRVLTPVEVERLNGFPDNWTKDMPERVRFFCMGNALVVDQIERIGRELGKRVKTEEKAAPGVSIAGDFQRSKADSRIGFQHEKIDVDAAPFSPHS